MPLSISAPVGPWEDPVVMQKRGNQPGDVTTVQKLLSAASKQTHKPQFDPGTPDGKIARAPRDSATLRALFNFQKQFLANPDRRVDVGGRTWRELQKYESGVGGPAAPQRPIGPPQLITYNGRLVPFFTQFDSRWGGRTLGTTKTLSRAGCAISSVAMVLKYYGRDMDPGKLDVYLDLHSGYSGDNVVWDRAFEAGEVAGKPKLKRTEHNFRTASQFDAILGQRISLNWPTLAHVDYGADANVTGDHWVVIVGRNAAGNYIVNDPGTSKGDGASNPSQEVTTIGESTRKGGLTIVRLCLFDVA